MIFLVILIEGIRKLGRKMEIDPKVIAEVIGEGVHTNLRKFCESLESYAVYKAICIMPNNEWDRVCEIVAEEVIKSINAHEVDNSFMSQMRRLNRSIDNLAEVIKIAFDHRSINEWRRSKGLDEVPGPNENEKELPF